MPNIVITGTTRGLGKSIAEFYLNTGWDVFGLARGKSTIQDSNYNHIEADITDWHSVDKAMSCIDDIDILVNNSSVFTMKDFANTAMSYVDSIIDTNLKGAMYVTRSALPLMQWGSRIFFINSVAGLSELENQSVYCASKYGLTAFAGVLGSELREKGIKVTSIHPGGINTTLWNEDNPYPCGDVSKALDTKEIAFLINFIYNSNSNTEYKTIKLFPTTEWHQ